MDHEGINNRSVKDHLVKSRGYRSTRSVIVNSRAALNSFGETSDWFGGGGLPQYYRLKLVEAPVRDHGVAALSWSIRLDCSHATEARGMISIRSSRGCVCDVSGDGVSLLRVETTDG